MFESKLWEFMSFLHVTCSTVCLLGPTELAGGYWIMLECVDNNPHWAVTKETETPEGCLKK